MLLACDEYDLLLNNHPTNTVNQYLLTLVDEEFDQFSQELRFISDPDRRIRWLAGGYFDTGSPGSGVHTLLAGMGGFDVRTDQDNDSWREPGRTGGQ